MIDGSNRYTLKIDIFGGSMPLYDHLTPTLAKLFEKREWHALTGIIAIRILNFSVTSWGYQGNDVVVKTLKILYCSCIVANIFQIAGIHVDYNKYTEPSRNRTSNLCKNFTALESCV